MAKRHLQVSGVNASMAICGRIFVQHTTRDKKQVTCKDCLRLLKEITPSRKTAST